MRWFSLLRKLDANNPGMGPNWDPFPLINETNLVSALALNLLWIVVFLGWTVSVQKNPNNTLSGGIPNRYHWVVAGLVWVVTLGATLLEFDPNYWLLGFAFANGAMLSILNPVFALCFSISMLMIRPWDVLIDHPIALELPRFSVMFSMAWAAFYFIGIDRMRLRLHRAVILLILYAGWAFLSTFRAPNPQEAFGMYSDTMIRAMIIFFLIFHLARDRFAIWAIKISIIIAFAGMGVIAYVFYLNGLTETGRIIGFGLFGNSNDVAACMAVMVALTLTPYLKPSDWVSKFLYAIPMGVGLLVLRYAQSRGAFLALMAMGCAYLFMKMKNKLLVGLIAGFIFLSGYVAIKVLVQRNADDLEGSSENRMAFVIAGTRMAIYNPVFGVGFGQFPYNYDAYTLSFEGGEWGERVAHSTWVTALAENGWIGFILFIAFYLVMGIRSSIRTFQTDPSLFCAYIAYTVAISFLTHTYMMLPYILIATIVAAEIAFKPRSLNI